jgi:hypothetical protein
LLSQSAMFQALDRRLWFEQDVIFKSLEPDIIHEPNSYLCLPNIDPDIFQRLCDFLYQGVIPEVTPSWIMEEKLYRLADLLGVHHLMNGLVDALQVYHFRTDTHLTINQVRSLSRELDGSGAWTYGVMGIAYQLFHGLFAEDDRTFDLLCQDFPIVSDRVLLEVKRHVKDFHAGMDYRQHGWGNELGFGVCRFHIHVRGHGCQREDYEPSKRAVENNTPFLGRYPVESKASVNSDTSVRSLESRIRRSDAHSHNSRAAKRRRQQMATEQRASKTMLRIRKVRMPQRVRV